MSTPRYNWAGNLAFQSREFLQPTSIAELQQAIANASHVSMVGTAHSFNAIADTPHTQISLAALPADISLDSQRDVVRVAAGIRYGELANYLDAHGYALANMASLPHISVIGACATGTHGSGVRNGSLATAVRAVELITASGDLVRYEHGHADFAGAVVNLGALGAVATVELAIEPAFTMQQYVFQGLPWSSCWSHYDDIMAAAYSVSLFCSWSPRHVEQVWLKARGALDQETFFGANAATHQLLPVGGSNDGRCTDQLGIPGPWHHRLPHFKLDFTPSHGDELQTEYLLPACHAVTALQSIQALGAAIQPHLLISEIRAVQGDNLWLSPAYGTDCVAIHFTWKPDWPGVKALLPAIETTLAPFEARPHWGKLFSTPPATLDSLYEQLPAFRQLAKRLDPVGKFLNPFLKQTIFAE